MGNQFISKEKAIKYIKNNTTLSKSKKCESVFPISLMN